MSVKLFVSIASTKGTVISTPLLMFLLCAIFFTLRVYWLILATCGNHPFVVHSCIHWLVLCSNPLSLRDWVINESTCSAWRLLLKRHQLWGFLCSSLAHLNPSQGYVCRSTLPRPASVVCMCYQETLCRVDAASRLRCCISFFCCWSLLATHFSNWKYYFLCLKSNHGN